MDLYRTLKLGKQIKKTLMMVLVLFVTVILVHFISAFTLDRMIEYVEVPFASPKIGEELDGYRIAFITDTHQMPKAELLKLAELLNGKKQIDLVMLGGDYASKDDAEVRTMEAISSIQAPDGIYGVSGNHDKAQDVDAAMKKYGIVPLNNEGVIIRENLYLAGAEDLWKQNPDIELATKEAKVSDFVLLLAHNPDTTMEQSTERVDLALSGHTHGGQITFFGIWAPALTLSQTITEYGNRFQSGMCENHMGTPVYVSNGTGRISGVPRIFARPQVIIITLKKEGTVGR